MVSEVGLVVDNNPKSAYKNSSDYPKKRQSIDTSVPTTDLSEVIGISLVEEINNTVEKRLIQGQKGEDRLSREEPYQFGKKQSVSSKGTTGDIGQDAQKGRMRYTRAISYRPGFSFSSVEWMARCLYFLRSDRASFRRIAGG